MADTLGKSKATELVSTTQSLKIIGAGFGRTGTLSLKAALEELGFGPCYHMVEVFQHPEHIKLWTAVAQGKVVDWDRIFANYQATVDWPSCRFYASLMVRYPDAKVVLTVRDPDKWYESSMSSLYLIEKKVRHLANNPLRRISAQIFAPKFIKLALQILALWDGTFHGKFADKDYAVAIYNLHIEEVKRQVPPERLLVYNVKEGWEPLCAFLGVAVPEKSFPHLNESSDFVGNPRWQQVRARTKRRLVVVSVIALVTLFLGLRVWRTIRNKPGKK
jgi:Sulfotransferase domain